jgi:hypothetical protein
MEDGAGAKWEQMTLTSKEDWWERSFAREGREGGYTDAGGKTGWGRAGREWEERGIRQARRKKGRRTCGNGREELRGEKAVMHEDRNDVNVGGKEREDGGRWGSGGPEEGRGKQYEA